MRVYIYIYTHILLVILVLLVLLLRCSEVSLLFMFMIVLSLVYSSSPIDKQGIIYAILLWYVPWDNFCNLCQILLS